MTPPLEKTLSEQLGSVTATLCRRSWSNKYLDQELLEALGYCLGSLGAAALIAIYVHEDVTLKHCAFPSVLTEEALNAIADRVRSFASDRQYFHEETGTFHIIGGTVIEPDGREIRAVERGKRPASVVGYAALIFETKNVPAGSGIHRMASFHGTCTAPLLWQVIQQRVRVFLPVAPRDAERYWLSAREVGGPAERHVPPWSRNGQEVRTVTLGFDLRKSTFCMENADNPRKFALWLDRMVQILMRIAHRYGGIFDKFTGDGALVHFPVEGAAERFAESERAAVTSSLYCAVAMQKGLAHHLRELRKFMRLDSKVLGGAIGLDIAAAHWVLDERDNPITVGRGVVNACRLMDSTKAGCVRLTNIAYQTLPSEMKQFFSARPFVSKEFGAEMGIIAWELQNAWRTSRFPHVDEREVVKICEEIWGRPATSNGASSAC